MKKLFYVTFFLSFIILNAQKKQTIQTVYKDSKDGITTVYKDLKSTTPQIKSALQSLSKELKTTTDSLWKILVKQQLVYSWCFMTLLLASFFNWFLFYKRNLSNNLKYEKVAVIVQKYKYKDGTSQSDIDRYPSSYDKKYYDCEEEDFKLIPNSTISFFKYVHLTGCITLSVFSFYHFSDMLTGFINPEYGALKTITEMILTAK